MTVIQWVADFSERIKQLQQISQGAASGGAKELKVLFGQLFVYRVKHLVLNSMLGSLSRFHSWCSHSHYWNFSFSLSLLFQNIHVCLGSLFVPEAYITATRQYVAQANSWSLEELCLEVNVTTAQGAALDACSFGIKG